MFLYTVNMITLVSDLSECEMVLPFSDEDEDFTGSISECGSGPGKGYNHNIPLSQGKVDDAIYQEALVQAIRVIQEYDPIYCIVR